MSSKPTKTKEKRTRGEKRQLMAEIRKLIGKDLNDDEILKYLELRPNILAEYKRQILDYDRAFFESLDSVSAYSDYILKIKQIVRELQSAIQICSKKGQGQALVNAIWRKKEAFDSVLKWGQEFGFIEKRISELKVSSEVSFSTMSDEEVQEEIDREMNRMSAIMDQSTVMRPEIAELIDPQVKENIPTNVVAFPKRKKKVKKQAKVKFIVRTKAKG